MAKRQNRGRRGFRVFAALVFALIVAACVATGVWVLSPYKAYNGETFVEIEHGMSSRQIADQLQRQGVIRSSYAFDLIRVLQPQATLQAGEYRFDEEQTPWEVFQKIRRGEVFYEDFTVPEGSNMFDIANLLAQSDTVKPSDFLKAAADPASIRDLDPTATDLEGFLFPSTYRLTHQSNGKQLCHMMTAEFRKQWAALGGMARGPDIHRIVIVASLVEKETAQPQERPLVAAVFFNRLRVGMPLQCDPTAVYAALLENRYRGTIYKSDLASANPYNTYAHAGLPPGPIANPGKSSLEAALHPGDVDYLYFVAKPGNSGTHQFSATIAQHANAVVAYRKGSR